MRAWTGERKDAMAGRGAAWKAQREELCGAPGLSAEELDWSLRVHFSRNPPLHHQDNKTVSHMYHTSIMGILIEKCLDSL